MQLASLPQYVNNANRFREIVSILAKYGLAEWISDSHPDFIKNMLTSTAGQQLSGLSRFERIRMALTELGPTFIKLGQMLSTRADLIGPELADELAKLQANTPADPPETVRETITEELGHPPEELFAEFHMEAVASASIGQVHRARLKSGQAVVVKVQHKDIRECVTNDLEILTALTHLAETYSEPLRAYQPVMTAMEFRRTLLRELDFTRELRHMEQFSAQFRENESVHLPLPFSELSGKRVLTMEYLSGISVHDKDALVKSNIDLNEFARTGANMFLDMIFRYGFYHADPHPGNLMVLDNGVLGLLDCGMVAHFDDELREEFEDLLLAAIQKDSREMTDIIVRLGSVPPDLERQKLQSELNEFLNDYTLQSLENFDLSGALIDMTSIIRRFRIILPSGCSMLLKVLIMLEGTSRKLDPKFSLAELLEPYCVNAVKRRFSPQKILYKLKRQGRDWDRLLEAAPRDMTDILDRVKRGDFDVNLKHHRMEATVNRLVLGILTAAMFLGSTQLWSQAAPPLVGDISLFGALGYALAAFLGFRLLTAIRRTGNIKKR